MKNGMLVVAVAIFGALLAGCSGEPSESDIRGVLEKATEQANANIASMTGMTNMTTEIKSVKKIGCKEAQDSTGYNCDVTVTAVVPMLGEQTSTSTMRLIKGDDGWQAMN